MTNKFLITGGCGFIGLNLIQQMINRGYCDIRVVDNLTNSNLSDLEKLAPVNSVIQSEIPPYGPTGIQFIRGDILDKNLAISASNGCDITIHLAANTGVEQSVLAPELDLMTNVVGTVNYLEAARKNRSRNFVFASSGAPAGAISPPIHEEVSPKPVSPYGSSKLSGEAYCSSYFHSYDLHTVALRFSNVFGPLSKNKASVIPNIIRNTIRNEPIKIYGTGQQTRDFIYVDDLVSAIIQVALSRDIGGEVFQIATGIETSINQVLEHLVNHSKKTLGTQPSVQYVDARIGDVLRNYSDISKATKMLNWRPEASLPKAIESTFNYFLEANSEIIENEK